MSALVLFYHRVGPFAEGRPRKMNVDPSVFRAQMEAVADRYRFVGLDDWLQKPPDGAAAVTFDDGYRDVVEHALPTLKEMRIPATLFVVAGAVGGKDTWYHGEAPIASWDDLKRWTDAGMSVGSHGLTHGKLTGMREADLRREVVESRRVLEDRLGTRILHFAYPQGRCTSAIERLVEEAGYRAAWGTRGAHGGPFARRRIRMSARDRGFRLAFKLLKLRWGLY